MAAVTTGVTLKEGNYIFPPKSNIRANIQGIKAISRKLYLAHQAIDALKDQYYALPQEEKEKASVQQRFWENVEKRVLKINIFNHDGSFTGLDQSPIPMKVVLPEGEYYFPVEPALSKEMTNQFYESKKFARELYEVVTAASTMRKDPLFGCTFRTYPTKDAFLMAGGTAELSGEKYLAIGMYEVLPKDMEEGVGEDPTITAIKDLVKGRWDQPFFKRIIKTKNLTLESARKILRELSRETTLTEKVVRTTFKAASIIFLIFVAFSFILFLTQFTPWNHTNLIRLNLERLDQKGIEPEKCPVRTDQPYHRILVNMDEKSEKPYEVTGLYEAKGRLENIFPVKWSLFRALDRFMWLSYEKPLTQAQLELSPIPRYLKLDELEGLKGSEAYFNFKSESRERRKWGRDIFTVRCSDTTQITDPEKKVEDFTLEIVVVNPKMVLESKPGEVNFEQASSGIQEVNKVIRLFGNILDKGKVTDSEEVTNLAYMRIEVPRGEDKVPLRMLYTLSDGTPITGISYAVKQKRTAVRREGEEQPGDGEWEEKPDEEGGHTPRSDAGKEEKKDDHQLFMPSRKDVSEMTKTFGTKGLNEDLKNITDYYRKYINEKALDTFVEMEDVKVGDTTEKRQIEYYRPKDFPKDTPLILKMEVKAEDLPKVFRTFQLKIRVPGVKKGLSIPISFTPVTTVEYEKTQRMDMERDRSNGMAKEFKIQKRIWQKEFELAKNEWADFTFKVDDPNPPIYPYPSVSVGLKYLGDASKQIYFYNPQTGGTYAIPEYRWQAKYEYNSFATPEKDKNYADAKEPCFDPVSEDKKSFKIRRNIAMSLEAVFIVIPTDKNVEGANLTATWNDQTITLPITAKTKENLKIVKWKPEGKEGEGVKRYNPKDWLSKIDITAPYGFEQVEFIIFSGEQPISTVSENVYLRFDHPDLANGLFQTIDGDWFSRFPEGKGAPGIKTMDKHLKTMEWGEKKDVYFTPDQKLIGEIGRYLIVAGSNVMPGAKPAQTKLSVILPKQDMAVSLDIEVKGEPEKKMGWSVDIDDKTKTVSIITTNYPRAQARKLANQVQMLSSAGTTMLIHSGQHRVPKPYAHEKDRRIADVLRWCLLSVGKDTPVKPIPGIMEGLPDSDLFGLMRENLFLCWSPQAQLMIAMESGLSEVEDYLEKGGTFDLKGLKVDVVLPPVPPIPSVTVRPPLFDKVEVSLAYNTLLFDNSPPKIERFCQSYYSGIQKDLAINSDAQAMLSDFYPEPDSLAKQTVNIGGVKVSQILARNFQYSLWDTRVAEFNKPTETLWLSFLLVTPDIGNPDGQIDTKKVDYLAQLLEDELRTYFLAPISIRRVLWKDLKFKDRNIKENKDKLTPEEAAYLREFTERALMSQLDATINQCWYSSFTLYMSQSFFDKVPFGNKWMYLYTYLPGGEKKQIKLFRRDSATPTPWAGEYKIKFLNDGNNYVVQIDNCTIFQKWFVKNYPTGEAKDEDIVLDLYYQDIEGEHRVGLAEARQGPILKSAVVHPESVLLYQVEGYGLSANYVRELISQLQFTGNFFNIPERIDTVMSQVGPVVIPIAGQFTAGWEKQKEIRSHTLTWQQIPPPPAEERTFPNMVKNFNFELLYLDTEEDLPQVAFGTLQKICSLYDKGDINQNLVADLLEEIFKKLQARVVLITPELAQFYAKPSTDTMFQYEFKEGHQLTLRIPAPGQFTKPAEFKGNHPEIYTNPKSKGQMVFIWKITPKKATGEEKGERGYPKYIVDPIKSLFVNKKSVFFKEE